MTLLESSRGCTQLYRPLARAAQACRPSARVAGCMSARRRSTSWRTVGAGPSQRQLASQPACNCKRLAVQPGPMGAAPTFHTRDAASGYAPLQARCSSPTPFLTGSALRPRPSSQTSTGRARHARTAAHGGGHGCPCSRRVGTRLAAGGADSGSALPRCAARRCMPSLQRGTTRCASCTMPAACTATTL